MKIGTRVLYRLNDKEYVGRFIRANGAYNYFMRGPGKFSVNAHNVIELYPVEFKKIK